MGRFSPLLLALLVGCGGAIENAQDALNITAVVVNEADDLATARFIRAIQALGLTEEQIASVRADFEPVREAMSVVRQAVVVADYALDMWREGLGSVHFYMRLLDLVGALEKLGDVLVSAGVSAPGLQVALGLLQSILDDR